MSISPFSHRTPRTWTRITLTVSPAMIDSAIAGLTDFTGTGVEIRTGSSPAEPTQIIGYLEKDAGRPGADQLVQLDLVLEELNRRFPNLQPPARTTETIEEEDWCTNWKKEFKPFHISPHLVIKPSWEEYRPRAGEAVIELDPGLAFGTGHHASTRLALQLIDDFFQGQSTSPAEVLDVGCGTGILAMACGLFGGSRITATDNDPDAVAAARDNVARNNLASVIEVNGQDVSQLSTPFDLITANITHDVLTGLAPELTRLLKLGGRLILAGILRGEQATSIIKLYNNKGLILDQKVDQDEWTGLAFTNQLVTGN